jgi:ABC-2 type transport system ATP-binding protein
MIQFKNVQFGYNSQKLFVDLSLHVEAGHIYGLLGENGAGKTTLLKMIAGLVFPKSGHCSVLNYEPRHRKPSFMSQLYFVSDEPYLPNATARKYADTYGVFYENFDLALYLNYLHEFQVEPDQKFERMSFGQRNKAVISFALAANTPLILMDEPTNGLDIPSKSIFRKLVAGAMSENRTIIISTHQVRDLDSLIDWVILLHQGKIIYQEDLNVLVEEATAQPNLETLFQEVISNY